MGNRLGLAVQPSVAGRLARPYSRGEVGGMLRGSALCRAFAADVVIAFVQRYDAAPTTTRKLGNMDTLYDSGGHAIAYVDNDGTSIYLYDGSAVGWIDQVDVYAYSGRYLGWMQDGWFFDRSGNRAFFTDATSGGPAKPARASRPPCGDRAERRARGARQSKPARPACALSWAPSSGAAYFSQ
jgi:hypothetical protein